MYVSTLFPFNPDELIKKLTDKVRELNRLVSKFHEENYQHKHEINNLRRIVAKFESKIEYLQNERKKREQESSDDSSLDDINERMFHLEETVNQLLASNHNAIAGALAIQEQNKQLIAENAALRELLKSQQTQQTQQNAQPIQQQTQQ